MKYRLSVSIVAQRPQDGKLLVVTNRRFGGFSVPGGKVEPGETFTEAAAREFLEETGCEALNLQKWAAYEHPCMQRDPDEDPWLCMGFTADLGDQDPKQMEEGTIPSWKNPTELVSGGMYRGWYEWFFDIAGISY